MQPSSLFSSEVRALLHERLDALLSDCDTVMDSAAYGHTLHDLDDFLFIAGKVVLKVCLAAKVLPVRIFEPAQDEFFVGKAVH